jgi:glyoxylase-like metal-dependent hydrolase (beta-lactamase superfamily II)
MPLTAVAPGLWSYVHRQRLPGGAVMQTRMNVVRLGDGALLVHSPTPVDDGLAAEIAALGQVAFIVAPNCYHHLHVAPFLTRFPGAKLFGPPGLAAKRPDLALAGTLDDGAAAPWAGTLDQIALGGAPKLNEVVFLHRPSRSLLVTDLLFNMTAPDNWMTGLALRLMGTYKRLGPSRLLRWRLTKDRRALKADVERMLAWDFARVLPGHGDVFESPEAPARVRASLGWVLA